MSFFSFLSKIIFYLQSKHLRLLFFLFLFLCFVFVQTIMKLHYLPVMLSTKTGLLFPMLSLMFALKWTTMLLSPQRDRQTLTMFHPTFLTVICLPEGSLLRFAQQNREKQHFMHTRMVSDVQFLSSMLQKRCRKKSFKAK